MSAAQAVALIGAQVVASLALLVDRTSYKVTICLLACFLVGVAVAIQQ